MNCSRTFDIMALEAIALESPTILVIDDEPGVCEVCRLYLEKDGFRVHVIHRGDEALGAIAQLNPDLVVLDIMLPGESGWDICRRLRETNPVPVLMLTARDEDEARIRGFELGADDYLVKPFNPRELVARVKAILRRAAGSASDGSRGDEEGGRNPARLEAKGLVLDAERRQVWLNGEEIHLTPKEFDILHLLMQRPGKTFTRTEMLEIVWGYDYFGDERTIDVHIKRLRSKIEPPGLTQRYIQTVWGVGYRFGVHEGR